MLPSTLTPALAPTPVPSPTPALSPAHVPAPALLPGDSVKQFLSVDQFGVSCSKLGHLGVFTLWGHGRSQE